MQTLAKITKPQLHGHYKILPKKYFIVVLNFLKLPVEKYYKYFLPLCPVVVFLTLSNSSSKMRQWTGIWNESELMYLLFLLDNTSSSSQ